MRQELGYCQHFEARHMFNEGRAKRVSQKKRIGWVSVVVDVAIMIAAISRDPSRMLVPPSFTPSPVHKNERYWITTKHFHEITKTEEREKRSAKVGTTKAPEPLLICELRTHRQYFFGCCQFGFLPSDRSSSFLYAVFDSH